MIEFKHKPALLNEVLDTFKYLGETKGAIFVDGTVGLAGHSLAIAKQVKGKRMKVKVVGIDKDEKALEIAKERIANCEFTNLFELVHDDYTHFPDILKKLKIEKVDGVLLDLGVSSMQLDDKSRGFSFQDPEIELDMRMDQSQKLSAFEIVNNYSEAELERVLKLGEEWHFKKIAREICIKRKMKTIKTVGDLTKIIWACVPHKYSKTHFATDTFRALRLEVNNEVSELKNTISNIVGSLNPCARLAIITFHSIEDRIVKTEFRRMENPCVCPPQMPICSCGMKPQIKVITKKPIIASEEELANNPRARSAKLRVIEKSN